MEVDALQAEVADGAAQLQWLEDQLQQVEKDNYQLETTINERKRVNDLQENGKGGQIFKLQSSWQGLERVSTSGHVTGRLSGISFRKLWPEGN